MRSWVLELPVQAPMNMNHRLHWAKKNALTQELIEATIFMVRKHRIPRLGQISVRVVYGPARGGRRDPINIMPTSKAVEDGLVLAGVVPDDTPQYVETLVPVILEPGPPNTFGGRLWVSVCELRAL